MDIKEVLRRFDELNRRLMTEPDAVRKEFDAKLIEERGQEWFDANRKYIDNDWHSVAKLLGFPPTLREELAEPDCERGTES